MGLRRHLVLVLTLFASVLVVATLVPFAIVSTQADLTSYMEDQILTAQRAVGSLPRTEGAAEQALRKRYPRSGPTAAWLLGAPGGETTEPTDRDAFPPMEVSRPQLEQARHGRAAVWVAETPAGKRVLVAFPAARDESIPPVLWLSSTIHPVARLNYRTWVTAGAIGTGALLAAVAVGVALARRLTRRLQAVARGAARFGAGRLTELIKVEGHDEVASVATRLNQMAAQIDHLVRVEKDFVAAASHQIRTPLAVIKIRIDEIRSLTTEDVQVQEDLDEMAEEIDRLTALVTRLLTLSAADQAGEGALARVDATREIANAVRRISPLAQVRDVGVSVTNGVMAAVSERPPGAFSEVVFNLLDNAVKFSPRGETILIRADRMGQQLVVEIKDRGPGIPPNQRKRVFEPFFQARHKDSRATGSASQSLPACVIRQEPHFRSIPPLAVEPSPAQPGRSQTHPDPRLTPALPSLNPPLPTLERWTRNGVCPNAAGAIALISPRSSTDHSSPTPLVPVWLPSSAMRSSSRATA